MKKPIEPFKSEEPEEPEHLVSAEKAAEVLGITPRLLQSMARRGIAGAYPLGTGDFRKV
jgi:hypothetical protein